MELETAFYIVAIVYMGLMFILFIALLAAVLVIKAKINKLHDSVDAKINLAKSVAGKGLIGLNTLRYFIKK
jgi:hypothetical protein